MREKEGRKEDEEKRRRVREVGEQDALDLEAREGQGPEFLGMGTVQS